MGTSILDRREVTRAQVGPRDLKDPRSKAYAIQTLYALKRYAESLRCDQERVAKELAEIDRYRHWEVLGYPSKAALLEAELNEQGRANVSAVLEAAPDLQPTGRPKKGSKLLPLSKASQDSSRLAARLKAHHPDICARIQAGEFRSIRAAAIAAGIVKVKSPLDQLRHWWAKASVAEQQEFFRFLRDVLSS